MTTERVVRIDDTHPNLRYSGPWEAINGTLFDYSPFTSQTFRSTLHYLTKEGSFEFKFDGGGGAVRGTRAPAPQAVYPNQRPLDGIYPQIACSLDGIDIATYDNFGRPEYHVNGFTLCGWNAVSQAHTLTVNISFPSPEDATPTLPVAPFLLDYVQFTPSVSQRVDNETIGMSVEDPSIVFEGDWKKKYFGLAPTEAAPNTNADGATMRIPFNGTGILVQGCRAPSELNSQNQFINATAMATYTLDDQDSGTFMIQALPDAFMPDYAFVDIAGLSPGPHALTITYNGNQSTLSFVAFRIFVYRDIVDPPSTVDPNSPPFPTTSGQSSLAPASGVSKGLIIGTTIGGILLVGGLFWMVLVMLRKKRRKGEEVGGKDRGEEDCGVPLLTSLFSRPRQDAPRPYPTFALPTPGDHTRNKKEENQTENGLAPPPSSLSNSPSSSGSTPPSKLNETSSSSTPTPSTLRSTGGSTRPVAIVEHPPLYTPT